MLFEDGGLRYIRLGERELVRRVYCAVRDENWGTVPARFRNLGVFRTDDSFHIEFDAEHVQGEINFIWHGLIRGEATGRIVFEMDGVARSDFRKNRIGFCILHPISLAGERLTLRHADGSSEQTEFPRWIAPFNPFLNVVGLRHAAGPEAEVELTFAGDVFEAEDQRNWLDASFKTFCTPLSRPFPALVRAGDRFVQSVTIELVPSSFNPQPEAQAPECDAVASGSGLNEREIVLQVSSQPSGKLPHIGFDLPADAPPLDPLQVERLRLLKPDYLRCELRLSGDFQPVLQQAILASGACLAGLELVLYLSDSPDRDWQALRQAMRGSEKQLVILHWVVFPETGWATTREIAQWAAKRLRPISPVGGGTPANFLELNRNRPPVDLLDFVVWSQNPQVHASDEASMVETLQAHAALVESAWQFAGGLPLVVGPITLKPRVNPYATGPWPPTTPPGQLPPDVDPRQSSLFAAAWTLASVKYLAASGVSGVSYYQPAGPKGIVDGDHVFPLYHVFADLAEWPNAEVLPVRSTQPLLVEALALRRGTQDRILIANLSPQPQRVELHTRTDSARIRLLDQTNQAEATASPEAYRARAAAHSISGGCLSLELSPYALARLDLF